VTERHTECHNRVNEYFYVRFSDAGFDSQSHWELSQQPDGAGSVFGSVGIEGGENPFGSAAPAHLQGL
jgi:hypothetical protein